MYYKLASISLTSTQKNNTSTEVYISQPDANKEALAGKLFVLAEIESDKVGALKIINFLINNLNYNYYNNEKIILRERITTLKVEHIFETSLAKTNNELSEFIKKEKIKLKPNFLNITIGVIYEDKIHFSNIGKNKALLIYKKKENKNTREDDNFSNQYKVTDVIQAQKEGTSHKKTFNKLFSNIVSGTIPKGGYFLFSNETLPEYLSNKQLLEIITKLPPTSSAEQIKNILSKVNAYVSFVGILIKNTVGAVQMSDVEYTPASTENIAQESISKLNNTEEKTEKYLTPSGMINFKKWFKKFTAWFTNIEQNPKTKSKIISIKDKIFFKKKPSIVSLKKIIVIFLSVFIGLFKILQYIFSVFTNKEKFKNLLNNIKISTSHIKNSFLSIGDWWINLNKKNKAFMIILVLLALFFTSSVTITVINNNKIKQDENLSKNYETLELKQNQVEANLLYNNEDGAKEVLNEIEILLKEIPKETDDEKKWYDDFVKKNSEQLEKIQHVVKINNPIEIANFSNLNSQANAENIILLNNNLYSADSKQSSIYKANLDDLSATAITDLGDKIINTHFPIKDKNNNIYYLNNDKLLMLDTKNEDFNNVNINIASNYTNITAMASYNNRVYLLDKKDSQIYRHTKSADGFTKRDPWLLQNVDLSKSISLDIDGHIYVLNNDGKVFKFLKGKQVDFNLDDISPEFTNPTKMLVSPDLEFIYILEPINNRLVIFNKAGDFLMQYKSDKFDNLQDFAIDEINKKIYFLNDNIVYATEGVHFE